MDAPALMTIERLLILHAAHTAAIRILARRPVLDPHDLGPVAALERVNAQLDRLGVCPLPIA